MEESKTAPAKVHLTPQFATLVGALLALVGALVGHYVSQINTMTTAAKDVDVKKLEVANAYKLEKAKHEHQVELEAQKFVRDIIAKTLEKGTAEEQTRNLKAYAKINLIGTPYKEALLSLTDQELPSIDVEKILGKSSDNLNPHELDRLLRSSRAVGRVLVRGNSHAAMGTGFLISDRVLMTVYHVLPNKETAQHSSVQFGYERTEAGGVGAQDEFAFDPQALFMSSEESGYTIVAVQPLSKQGSPLTRFGSLVLSPGKVVIGTTISIVHHPKGEEKKIVFRGGSIMAATANVLHYGIFTEPGSGGAPVFNDQFEVIAVHSGFVPAKDKDGRALDAKGAPIDETTGPIAIRKTAKEGYQITGMLRHLTAASGRLPPAQQVLLKSLLSR